MARSDATQRLGVSPSKVWLAFTPERLKLWYGAEIRLLSAPPLQKGSQLHIRYLNRPVQYEAIVTEYAPNRSLIWEGSEPSTTYRVAFLLVPKGDHTVVLLREEFHRGGTFGRLAERLFLLGRVAKRSATALGKLKRMVESD
jgi:hypothetical protein